MSLEDDIESLRRYLDRLADDADDDLVRSYMLKRPSVPPGFYWRLRWLVGHVLRWIRSVPIWQSDPWPVSLKQAPAGASARPLLIWAVGVHRDALRDACGRFSRLRDVLPGFAPVLVTDVADFAFFSRLGWLVEYLPRLTGEGEPYEERKAKFLARLYRGAPAFPLSASFEMERAPEVIRQWLDAP